MNGQYSTPDKIYQRIKEQLSYFCEHSEDDWFGIFLFGSQNYDLQWEESDIDSRVISIPKNPRALSECFVLDNGEHLEVIPIYYFCQGLLDMNNQVLETLFSRFYIPNMQFDTLLISLYYQHKYPRH